MSPPDALRDLFARLARALASETWYLFGARAAIHYGSVRATVDVDLCVRPPVSGVDALVARLQAAGIETRIADWRALLDSSRVLLLREDGIRAC